MSSRRQNHSDLPRDQRPPYRPERYSAPYAVPSARTFHQPPAAFRSARNFHERSRWPPQPYVEDESTALQKEAGLKKLDRDDEVSERGAIDQDPILIDLSTPPPSRASQPTRPNAPRRPHAGSGVPTPPVSDDEKAARGRRQGPRLDTGVLPEMMRAPSPYHYSHPQPPFTRTLNGHFSASPSLTTPPYSASGFPKSAQLPTNQHLSYASPSTTPKSNVVRPTPTNKGFAPARPSAPANDGGLDEVEADRRRGQRHSPRATETPKISYPEPSKHTLPKRPLLSDDNRRHTDSWVDITKEQVADSMRRATPLMVSSATKGAPLQPPQHACGRTSTDRLSSRNSPRGSAEKISSRNSPRTSTEAVSRFPPSPPKSPRESLDRLRDALPGHKRSSLQSSAESSYAQSPQHSPKIGTVLPASASAWQNAFDSNTSRLSHTSTRPSPAIRADTMPYISNISGRKTSPVPRSESLPYPVDDPLTVMPEERDHQFYPEGLKPEHSSASAKTLSRIGTPLVVGSAGARPSIPKHHSFAETAPATPASPYTPRHTRQVSFALPDKTAATSPTALFEPTMAPCPCARDIVGYSDWYTLEGCPNFDICRSCLDNVFGSTFYAGFFHKVPTTSRSPGVGVHCDFANSWFRLAWVLTQQRQLPNLNLLKELHHHLEASPPCPGKKEEHGHWWSILDDSDQQPIRYFHVCSTDIRAIEILLPRLRGFWVPYSRKSTPDMTKRKCSLRWTDNNRFAVYLNSMISLHESVHHLPSNKVPDMRPFVRLVKRKVKIAECQRNDMLRGDVWKCYYISGLPEFSVCEDCHDDIVAPLVRADSDLAMRFNETIQYLPASSKSPRSSGVGFTDTVKDASCSLFSPRMRRYFRRAVENNDLKYLTRKAKDRRRKELELHAEVRVLTGKIHEIDEQIKAYESRPGSDRYISRLEDESDRLVDELGRCHEEWAKWE